MSSTLIPSQDLVPSVSSRIVTIDATSMLEATPDGEHWVDFILPQDLHVAADDKIIMAGSERITLDGGKGSIRLPCYDSDAKTVDGSSDWVILVKKSWTGKSCSHGRGCGCGGAYAIRVPVGTSSISLADLPAVRALTPREQMYAVTGASVTVTEGAQWDIDVSLSGGVLDFDFTVPPGGTPWPKGTLPAGNVSNVYTPGQYVIIGADSYQGLPADVTSGSGFLTVYANAGRTWGYQEYTQFGANPGRWWRISQTQSGTWNPWYEVPKSIPEAWSKGTLPAGNVSEALSPGQYLILGSSNYQGLPSGLDGNSGFLTVYANGGRTWGYQEYVQFGNNPGRWWRVSKDLGGTWNSWTAVTEGGSSGPGQVATDAGLRHQLLASDFKDRIGTRRIPGKAAIVFRFDHYLNVYRDQIRPLMTARGFKATIAMNSRTWDAAQNNQVTPAEADTWTDVEFANHGAHHSDASTDAALYDTIALGQSELQAQLPNHAIDGFIVPGVGGTQYGGWGTGSTLTSFADYEAGRLILGHHAYSTGSGGSVNRKMDGQLRQGLSHYGIESRTFAPVKTAIDSAVASNSALTLMMHPDRLGTEGNISVADLTQIFDYVESLVDAGDVEVLTLGESLLADSTASELDTGTIETTSLFPEVTRGRIFVRRVGNAVHVTLYDVEFANSTPPEFFYLDGALPVGYRPATLTSFPALADVNGTTTRRVRFQADGQILLYDITASSRINATVSYLTPDPEPAS